MLPENYFEMIKKINKLEKAYKDITKFVDSTLIKLNIESADLFKQQQMLMRKFNNSTSSNDKGWCQQKLVEINSTSLQQRGALKIIKKIGDIIKDVETDDKEIKS